MTLPLRILLQALAGLAIGACLVLLAAASALVLAFATANPVAIPAVIAVSPMLEPNGTTALEFVPDLAGSLVVMLAIAAVYTVATVVAGHRRAPRG